ncbi:MAG: DMT family transporter [Clostridia bacterium]|nr:DMT family transporter [Clostridia bacterium]
MNKNVYQRFGVLFCLLITAAWGSSFIMMKLVADEVSAMAFLTLRFSIASVIMALIFHKKLRQFTKKTVIQSLILGALVCGSMSLQVVGLRDTSASNSGFITSLSVLIVPILSTYMLRKKPTASNWIGIATALVGLGFITGIFTDFTALNVGDLLTLGCALIVAVHMIVVDRFTETGDALLLGIGQIFGVFAVSLLLWLMQEPRTFASVNYTPGLVWSVVLTAVICTCFAYTGQVVMQKHMPPARISLLFTFEPVFALLYALVIPGPEGVTEVMTVPKIIGCVLVMAGTFFSELDVAARLAKKSK